MPLKMYTWGKLVRQFKSLQQYLILHSSYFVNTAEHLARKYNVSRQDQDEYAALSQNKAENAIKTGYFEKEIVSITSDKTRKPFLVDEHPRFETNPSKLSSLKPCFVKKDSPYVCKRIQTNFYYLLNIFVYSQEL